MQNKAFSMEDLFAFLNAGVSAFHSTAAAAAILEANGMTMGIYVVVKLYFLPFWRGGCPPVS